MKKNRYRILDTGKASAAINMQVDSALLSQLGKEQEPILHLYEWEGVCATYGYFIKPEEYLDSAGVLKYALQTARRPTGGGIVFHHCDFAFSFLMPAHHSHFFSNTLDNYAFVNKMIIDIVRNFRADIGHPSLLPENLQACDKSCYHFCMAKPTIYDVMLDGRKVGGAAQRRTKEGYLHQGTIALAVPSEVFLSSILKDRQSIVDAIQQHTYPLLGHGEINQVIFQNALQRIKQLFVEYASLGG